MGNRVSAVVIIVLLAVAGYFAVQNVQLKKKLAEQENPLNHIIAPAIPETRPANPEGASPFEKPNVDPVADQFKSQPDVDTMPVAEIKFDKMVYDFGRITEGDVVKTQFKFTNTSKVVLLISHAQPSCGCTVPTTPKDPVKPGESNVIDVVFNSIGKRGETIKTIAITANTKPRETTIAIKATVIPKDR